MDIICRTLHSLTSLTVGSLETYLARCGISEEGAVAISRHLPRLEEHDTSTRFIDSDQNSIGKGGAEAIASHLLRLKKLWIGINQRDLEECGIGDQSFICLASKLK